MSRRAKGSVFRPTYTDRHGKKRTGRVWHIRYNRSGERFRESSGSTDKGVAEELLARRIAEMRPGGPLPSELEQVTFEELADLLRADYEAKGNRSSVENRLIYLGAAFGEWRVIDIGEAEIDRYKTKRREGGAAPATVNRELSALRRAFNLAERRSLVARVPTFELYPERNRREGFLEPADFEKFRKELPPRLQPVAEVLYITGWRKGETLSRDWRHVDFEHGWIRLEASETKEGMPRQFPLIPRLRAVLEAQRERREQVGRETGRKVEALFFYYEPAKNGTPAGTRIKSFRKAWETAARKASVRVVPHDMRRSAVRNLVRAGVPERVAMQYTGHLTRSVFERYNIVSEADLREQAGKLQTFLDASGR
jgi:integrase